MRFWPRACLGDQVQEIWDQASANTMDVQLCSSLGFLHLLPPQFLDSIVQCLSARHICTLSCTSKALRLICQQEALWRIKWQLCRPKIAAYKGSWKATILASVGAPDSAMQQARQQQWLTAIPTLYHQRLWYRCHFQPDPISASVCKRLEQCQALRGGFFGRCDAPQVWTGLMDSWSTGKWTTTQYMQSLFQKEFRVAKPGGGSCFMPLLDYLHYAARQQDEEPLYIFDEGFGERAPCMLDDFRVPHNTPDDLFEVRGEMRPDFRWLVMGPMRSGSSWHQDPCGTHAWNALIAGKKRWLFYPPDVTPPGIEVSTSVSGDQVVDGPNPVQWLLEVYPTLAQDMLPSEHLQQPGEVIYVPSRWWHFTINVTDSIAVTQNYVPLESLEDAVSDLAWGSGHHSTLSSPQLQLRKQSQPAALQAKSNPLQSSAEGGSQVLIPGNSQESESHTLSPTADCGTEEAAALLLQDSDHHFAAEKALQNTAQDLMQPLQALCIGNGSLEAHQGACVPATSETWLPDLTGFRRSRNLGPWFRALAEQRPELQSKLVRLGQKYADLDEWTKALEGVCSLCSLSPSLVERFPISGGSSVLFMVGETVIKFYSRSEQMAALDAYVERAAMEALQSMPEPSFPRLIASSADHLASAKSLPCIMRSLQQREQSKNVEKTYSFASMPWIAMTAQRGQPVSSLSSIPDDLAAAVGKDLAHLHALPLRFAQPGQLLHRNPQGGPVPSNYSSRGPASRTHGDSRNAEDRLPMDGGKQGLHMQPFFKDEKAWAAAINNRTCPWQAGQPWQPFLSFLRSRRSVVHSAFFSGAGLPLHLLAQLEAFLPQDAALVTGCTADGCAPNWGPVLLHGDLTPANILAKADSSLSIIDFGDSGLGDPLYDLIPLHLVTFRGSKPCTQSFLAAYISAAQQQPAWLQIRNDLKPSFCAMCYTLLHEQDIFESVFGECPQLWETPTLAALQEHLWGFLDDFAC